MQMHLNIFSSQNLGRPTIKGLCMKALSTFARIISEDSGNDTLVDEINQHLTSMHHLIPDIFTQPANPYRFNLDDLLTIKVHSSTVDIVGHIVSTMPIIIVAETPNSTVFPIMVENLLKQYIKCWQGPKETLEERIIIINTQLTRQEGQVALKQLESALMAHSNTSSSPWSWIRYCPKAYFGEELDAILLEVSKLLSDACSNQACWQKMKRYHQLTRAPIPAPISDPRFYNAYYDEQLSISKDPDSYEKTNNYRQWPIRTKNQTLPIMIGPQQPPVMRIMAAARARTPIPTFGDGRSSPLPQRPVGGRFADSHSRSPSPCGDDFEMIDRPLPITGDVVRRLAVPANRAGNQNHIGDDDL